MKSITGKIAVVSGAGSGIGRALAVQLAEEGADLAINDINPKSLEETAILIREKGQSVFSLVVDVSKKEEVYTFAEKVVETFGAVDIVINNAGVALGKVTAEEVSYEDFEWIMGINFWGMVYGSKAFLPHLRMQKEATIINLSSILGLFAVPYQSPYITTKFAIRGFTEGLRQEMLIESPHVIVATVHPGGIRTNIASNAKIPDNTDPAIHAKESIHFERFFRTTADEAAKVIIKGIRKKKFRILIGIDAKTPDVLVRLLPSGYSKLIAGHFKKMIKKLGL